MLTILEKIEWRAAMLRRKLRGDLRGIGVEEMTRSILALPGKRVPPRFSKLLRPGEIEKYDTPWGEFELPSPGQEVLDCLLQEIYADEAYQNEWVHLNAGDVVVDCGAHVGVFSRFALSQGAARVLSIEMDAANYDCLLRNTAGAADRVNAFNATLWSRATELTFKQSDCSDCHSAGEPTMPGATRTGTTLDAVLAPIGLGKLDFVKVDVEGAESQVLQGAAGLLRKHRPKLAIAVYHESGEDEKVAATLRELELRYQFFYKGLMYRSRPAILLCLPCES